MIPLSTWFGFVAFVIVALALDLGVFNKKDHIPSIKESLFWTILWTALAIGFKFFTDHQIGTKEGSEFLTGYLLERILSIDNIFVFVLIFSYFKTPSELQQRALIIGIILAIILRAIFIFAGASLVQSFSWILYIFGVFLVYTGAKIIFSKDEEHSLDDNPVVKFCRKHFGVTNEYHGHAFTTVQNGKKVLTMFALTVITLGTSDVIFAIDSIPAVFAITQNTYIVFTANVFSVLGLRAIFFLIANILHRFYYLKHALSIILAFIGVKMLIVDFYHIHTSYSLMFIASVFVLAIVASVVRKGEF
jgi:tellurite resistance protein TerC